MKATNDENIALAQKPNKATTSCDEFPHNAPKQKGVTKSCSRYRVKGINDSFVRSLRDFFFRRKIGKNCAQRKGNDRFHGWSER